MRKRLISAANGRAATVLATIAVGCCGTPSVLAQDNLTIDVADCVKLKSSEERLACYERHVDAATPNSAAPSTPPPAARSVEPGASPPVVPPAAVAPSAAAPAVAAATAVTVTPAAPSAPPVSGAPGSSSKDKEGPPDVVATITDLRETVPNTYLITLDNGQVWQQSFAEPYFLRPGMRVTLHSSKWGTAYRLTAEGLNGFIQVKRVK